MTNKDRQALKWLVENSLFIINKNRKKVRFLLNDIQDDFLKKLTGRDIILKARQEGFSSFILAKYFMDCVTIPYTTAVVITQDKEETQRQLDRVHFYYKSMRPSLKEKVQIDLSSRQLIRFTSTGSTFYIGTAGSKSFGRGDTISRLHISEIANWERTDVLAGLVEAVPSTGEIVMETTANGIENLFYHLWTRAKLPDSNYTPHFYGWDKHGEYTRVAHIAPGKTEFRLHSEHPLFGDEETLKKDYNLSNEQIAWRRWKISDMPEPDKFPQEYPINDMEAFMSTNAGVFDSGVLSKWYTDAIKLKPARGNLIDLVENNKGKPEFHADKKGIVTIYDYPEANVSYRIGADVAEGLENELKDRDWSTASVFHGKTWKLVATIKCRIDPDSFGEQCDLLGRYYNTAKLAVELNGHGIATLSVLKREKKYRNLYYKKTLDERSKKTTKKFGWSTDLKSRPIMISDLQQAIRKELCLILDPPTITELMAFIKSSTGKMQASPGAHDDTVISSAIGISMCKLFPYYPQNVDWSKRQLRK